MKLIDKILVGTDFSPAADAAIQQAVRLAEKLNSAILLVHVIPEMTMTNLSQQMVRETVKKELTTVSENLIDQGLKVETIVQTGIPFIELMKIAELRDVNVIMVGSGGENNSAPGMTAEKLMHKSIKPVWIVPAGQKSSISRILCPIDFSEASDRALENAIHLSRQFDLDLVVLHVIDQSLPGYLKQKLGLTDDQNSVKEKRQKELDQHLKRFDFVNVRFKKLLIEGRSGEEIIRQTQNLNADLILMGSVGKTAHPKMLTGNTARTVFRMPPVALIAFKSENIIQLKLENELVDIRDRFQQGTQLLENGFVREAIAHFKYCLNEDALFAPAWELLADAYFRLGQEHEAMEYEAKASEIRDKLWTQKVEAEIKNRSKLYNLKG